METIFMNTENSKTSKPHRFTFTFTDLHRYTFDLLDGSYSIADIQDYFEFLTKKRETSPVQINQIKSKTELFSKLKQAAD